MCASCTPCKEYRTVFQAIFVISFGKRTTIVKFRKISSTIVLRSFTIVKFRCTKFYEILRKFTIVTIVKFYDRKISYYDRRQPVFFEIFEKSADFATKFGWGISATKGSPLWKKNEIDQKRYPNISVFFGFHFVFFGFSGTRGNFPLRKKKKTKWTELHRIGPNS